MNNKVNRVIDKIILNDKAYIYEIEFKKIKNMYMRVQDEKILISANKKIPIYKIEEFIKQKEKWILRVIDKQKIKKEIIKKEKKYTDEEFINLIEENVKIYSEYMGVCPNKISLKKLKYAWGSCTSKKNISFNRELIYYDEDVIKYVIVHELAHLKYMNHQKKFWELVEKYIPNYKELRKKLKNNLVK